MNVVDVLFLKKINYTEHVKIHLMNLAAKKFLTYFSGRHLLLVYANLSVVSAAVTLQLLGKLN